MDERTVRQNQVMKDLLSNYSRLLAAAAESDVVKARQLLREGAPVNVNGLPQLFEAVQSARGVAFAGVDFSHTPLHEAAGRGSHQIVQLLLKEGAQVNDVTAKGYTALMFAAQEGHERIVHALLEAGANPRVKLATGHSALLLAAGGKRLGCVRELMQHGGHEAGDAGWALEVAVRRRHDDVAKLLLRFGAGAERPQDRGISLEMAARAGLGLRSGGPAVCADDIGPDGASRPVIIKSALHRALEHDDLKMVKLLLKHGADADCISTFTNGDEGQVVSAPLLHMAIQNNTHIEILRELLAGGANPHSLGHDGFHTVSRAASLGNVPLLELLLEHGANIRDPLSSSNGLEPIHMAAIGGHPAALDFFLRHGVSINSCNNRFRNTPLIHAVLSGQVEVAKRLICLGADLDQCGGHDRSARYLMTTYVQFGGESRFMKSMVTEVEAQRVGKEFVDVLWCRDGSEGQAVASKTCWGCGAVGPAAAFKQCGGCGTVSYCSKECQVQDWRKKEGGHKEACTRLKEQRLGIRPLLLAEQGLTLHIKPDPRPKPRHLSSAEVKARAGQLGELLQHPLPFAPEMEAQLQQLLSDVLSEMRYTEIQFERSRVQPLATDSH